MKRRNQGKRTTSSAVAISMQSRDADYRGGGPTPSTHGRRCRAVKSDMLTKVALLFVLLPHMAQTKYARDSLQRHPHFRSQEMQNHTMRVGSEASFACIVEHLGRYKVAWLHSEKGTLAVHPNVIAHNDRISLKHDNRHAYYLHLRNIQESDAGKYICQLNTDPVVSIRGSLNVVVPPDIIDEESSSDTLAKEGMLVTLICKAKGNPRTQIAWRREDGKPIRLCQTDKTIRSRGRASSGSAQRDCREVSVHYGSELSLPHVSRHDSGVYFCLASNGVPPTVSKKVRLYVDFPPTLWISHQLIGASEGDKAELECLTAAHPPSLNFWTRDGNNYIIPTPGKYEFETIEGTPAFYNIRMKLKIYNVSVADFGNYRCLAKNSQGETTGDIELYELPKPSTTSIIPFFEEYDDDIRPQELPKNETKVILLEENYDVPKVPKKNANNYNGRDRQFQKSQDSKASDTKGFHRNGDDSPFEKRYGSSGMSLCQNFRIFGVVLLTLVNLL